MRTPSFLTAPKISKLFLKAMAFCLGIVFLLHPSPSFSADADPLDFDFDQTQTKLQAISNQIKNEPISPQKLEKAKQQVDQISKEITACVDASTAQMNTVDQEISALGPNAEQHESAEIGKERKRLAKQKQALQITQSECKLLAMLTTRIQNELTNQNKALQAAVYLSKSPNTFVKVAKDLPSLAEFLAAAKDYMQKQSGLQEMTPTEITIFLLVLVAGWWGGLKIVKVLLHYNTFLHAEDSRDLPEAPTLPLKQRLDLPIAMAAAMSGGYLFYIDADLTPTAYSPWLLLSIGLYCLSLFIFYFRNFMHRDPSQPLSIPPPTMRFRILVFLCVVMFFFTRLELSNYSSLGSLLIFVQSLLIFGICLAAWCFLFAIKLPEKLSRSAKPIRFGVSAASILIIVIEISGYKNLSAFLLLGFFSTFLLYNILWLTLFTIDEVIGGIFLGKYQWQKSLRHWLGFSPQEKLAGIMWIRLIFRLLVWALGVLLFLQIWGISDAQRQTIISYLINGFDFGGLVFAPARILLGFFVFSCGWTLISWVKREMETNWLKQSYFSRSEKENLVTMTGYVGFALLLLIGISAAGVSFSNLAVIAGALSVGIGFGLQNIVNNFVSGLIILFERPIKRGDWISVGSTQGYVQKISVRSTVIQTFDRSDVIVPNSELISHQVTNMMLNDSHGRLIIPIGVAYGSDTALVSSILLDIAKANEKVINDGSAPAPQVLFLSFGDNSLNFELRCYLTNIDLGIRVRSAINYEIDRAFREHNISIPFPQHDLYIKEFPAGTNPVAAKEPADGSK
jgi:potassium efflux system protein